MRVSAVFCEYLHVNSSIVSGLPHHLAWAQRYQWQGKVWPLNQERECTAQRDQGHHPICELCGNPSELALYVALPCLTLQPGLLWSHPVVNVFHWR
jgi:hypothetical protein